MPSAILGDKKKFEEKTPIEQTTSRTRDCISIPWAQEVPQRPAKLGVWGKLPRPEEELEANTLKKKEQGNQG